MTLHGVVEGASGVLVAVLTLLAVAAFVTLDLARAARPGGSSPRSGWLRWCASVAWPLGIGALALAVVRVLVLA